MTTVLEALGWALLISGSVFSVIGGLGLLRLPDLFTRMHGGGITDTAGATLILAGLAVQAGIGLITVKLILLVVFLMLSSPTSTHALAKSALAHGVRPAGCDDGQERPSNT